MPESRDNSSPLDASLNEAGGAAPTSTGPTQPQQAAKKSSVGVGLARLVVYTIVAALAAYVVADRFFGDGGDEANYGPELVTWHSSWSEAETYIASGQGDKPILVQFTADWCGPCQHMKKTTFADADIAANIEQNWLPIKIDLTDQSNVEAGSVAQAFNVSGIPTYVALAPDGQPIGQLVGASDPDAFNDWLAQTHAKMPTQAVVPSGSGADGDTGVMQ